MQLNGKLDVVKDYTRKGDGFLVQARELTKEHAHYNPAFNHVEQYVPGDYLVIGENRQFQFLKKEVFLERHEPITSGPETERTVEVTPPAIPPASKASEDDVMVKALESKNQALETLAKEVDTLKSQLFKVSEARDLLVEENEELREARDRIMGTVEERDKEIYLLKEKNSDLTKRLEQVTVVDNPPQEGG